MRWPFVARKLEVPISRVGLTTFRMPLHARDFRQLRRNLARDLFDPVRTTPTHEWAAAKGAVFENVGLWKRAPLLSARGRKQHTAVARESLSVRSACGIFDRIDLGQNRDRWVGTPAEFMNRLYINNWTNLGVGRSRYGILCRDGRLHL